MARLALLLLACFLFLLLLPRGVLGSTCPTQVSVYSSNTLQIATFSTSFTTRGVLRCDDFGQLQNLQVARFTPSYTGYYYIGTDGFLGTGERAIAVRTGACFQVNNPTVDVCFSGIPPGPVLLDANMAYTILLGTSGARSTMSNANKLLVEYYGPSIPSTAPISSCSNNAALSTTSFQTVPMSNAYSFSDSGLTCGLGGSSVAKIVQYTSFTAPVSGQYYVRVAAATANLVLEIRTGCYGSSAVACNDDMDGSTLKTGFDALSLTAGTTYVIVIGLQAASTASIPGTNMVEIGLVGKPAGAPTTRPPTTTLLPGSPTTVGACLNNNALASRTSRQTVSMTSTYTYSKPGRCTSSSSQSMRYVSFRAPVNGTYFIRVPDFEVDLVMEVYVNGCDGTYLACNDDLGSTRITGFDGISLTRDTIYVILVGAYSSSTSLTTSPVLEIGLVDSAEPIVQEFGDVEYTKSQFLAIIIVPSVLFGLMLIAAVFDYRDDNARYYNNASCCVMCSSDAVQEKVRRLTILMKIAAMLVLVTNWAVYWSAAASLVALFLFGFARAMYKETTSYSFSSHRNMTMDGWMVGLFVLALAANMTVACVQAQIQYSSIAATCTAQDAYTYEECFLLLLIYPIFGLLSALGMFLLAWLLLSTVLNIQVLIK